MTTDTTAHPAKDAESAPVAVPEEPKAIPDSLTGSLYMRAANQGGRPSRRFSRYGTR